MPLKRIWWCILLFSSYFAIGQSTDTLHLQLVSVGNKEKPVLLSSDPKGNLYWSDSLQRLHKINKSDTTTLAYSPTFQLPIDQLDASQGIVIMTFSREAQQITLLDRFLTLKTILDLPDHNIGFARIACIAADNRLWLLDDTDFSLKKYDIQLQSVVERNPLDLQLTNSGYDFVEMREYQNSVFLLDAKGFLLVFDNLGNFQRKLPVPHTLRALNFHGDWLLFPQQESIRAVHLYDGSHKVLRASVQAHIKGLSNSQGQLWVYAQGQLWSAQLSTLK